MDVTTFFTRLLQAPKETERIKLPDDIASFDAAWRGIKDTLEHPDERQLARGIGSTDVPEHLRHIVDALVYEANRIDEDTTGACLEYFLRDDLLANLERLCEDDRPFGIKAQVLRLINDLVVSLSERFIVHNAIHRPLRRLLRSCVGDEPEDRIDGGVRVMGAAGMAEDRERFFMDDELEGDLVDLMCTLCSRMRAYPPLLLIFFHDKGWLQPHPSSVAPLLDPSRSNAMSPTPSTRTAFSDPSTKTANKLTHHFEFLLFSYMLRFVHREGRVGDLSRAGLLFLFDIAFLTATEEGGENLSMPAEKDGTDPLQDARDALGEYILDGEFADIMAAGIGAIYSLLPSKVKVPTLADSGETVTVMAASTLGGMHLGATLNTVEPPQDSDELPSSTEPEVRAQLDIFLKLLGFLQDIMYRCHSPILHADPNHSSVSPTHVLGTAISEAMLDAIRASFLDNILYPSILECSPNDGSAVAVMTYLDVTFSNLDEGPLLDRLIGFLMDTDSNDYTRRSVPLANEYFADAGRFTLKDLILDNLSSASPPSATAAFRLLHTLLASHCQHAVRGLLTPVRDSAATALARKSIPKTVDPSFETEPESILPKPVNSTDEHLQELELYGSLIARIDTLQTSTELTAGYSTYLADMHVAIQAETCFQSAQVPLQFIEDPTEDEVKVETVKVGRFDIDPFQHRLNPSDPLVRAVLEKFGRFLCQTPDENVALSGVLTSLALCPNRSLSGWLLYEIPSDTDPWSRKQTNSDDSDASSDVSADEPSRPVDTADDGGDPFTTRSATELPALYQILRDLVRQINRLRLDVDDFDRWLSERRQGLLYADHLDEAMNVMLEVEPSAYGLPSPVVATPLPKRIRPGVVGSLRSFLTPKPKSSPMTPRSSLGTPSSQRDGLGKSVSASSPFKSHYEQTSFFSLEAHTSSPVASGPWSPARLPPLTTQSRPRSALSGGGGGGRPDAASVMSSEFGVINAENTEEGVGGEDRAAQPQPPRKVTLSVVLDNCVILEEFLKEIVGVITARRALGVDQVGFV